MTRMNMGLVAAIGLSLAGVGHAQKPGKCPAECQPSCPHAAAGPRGAGWLNGPYARLYDPKSVESLAGGIVAVEHVAPMRGMSEGVHLTVKTDQGDTVVQLGPSWYLDNQEVQLAVGDRVQVRGSRVTVDGKAAIIAAELKKGSQTLILRDASGAPMWRGWR